MKKYTYALFATVLALLSTACSSDADQQIEIYTPATVNITVPGTLTFEESVTSMDFEIKSTTSWTIKDLPKWLKASMSSGQNDQTITFTAELNPSCYNQRTDSFHVIAAELNRLVIVSQKPALLEAPTSITFGMDIHTASFEIVSNTDWSVNNLPDWLTASATSGTGNKSITFLAAVNPSCIQTRSNTFQVTSGDKNISVTATQEPAAEYLFVSDNQGKEAPDEFSSDGGSYSFTIDSNTSWLISAPDDWVVVSEELGEGTKQITLQVTGNPLEEPRSSQVSISSTISQISKTMSIRQAALVKPNPGQEDNPTPDL